MNGAGSRSLHPCRSFERSARFRAQREIFKRNVKISQWRRVPKMANKVLLLKDKQEVLLQIVKKEVLSRSEQRNQWIVFCRLGKENENPHPLIP